jgi:hypothetical protein
MSLDDLAKTHITELLRPFAAKEMPLGLRVRRKDDHTTVSKLRRSCDDTVTMDSASPEGLTITAVDLLVDYEYQGKDDDELTWRPCGKPHDPRPAGKDMSEKAHAPWPKCGCCVYRMTEVGYRSLTLGVSRNFLPLCRICSAFYASAPDHAVCISDVRSVVWMNANEFTKGLMALAPE